MNEFEIVGLERLEVDEYGNWRVNGGDGFEHLNNALGAAGCLREKVVTVDNVLDASDPDDAAGYYEIAHNLAEAVVACAHANEIVAWLKEEHS